MVKLLEVHLLMGARGGELIGEVLFFLVLAYVVYWLFKKARGKNKKEQPFTT